MEETAHSQGGGDLRDCIALARSVAVSAAKSSCSHSDNVKIRLLQLATVHRVQRTMWIRRSLSWAQGPIPPSLHQLHWWLLSGRLIGQFNFKLSCLMLSVVHRKCPEYLTYIGVYVGTSSSRQMTPVKANSLPRLRSSPASSHCCPSTVVYCQTTCVQRRIPLASEDSLKLIILA